MKCKLCKTRLITGNMICPNCQLDNTPPEGVGFFDEKDEESKVEVVFETTEPEAVIEETEPEVVIEEAQPEREELVAKDSVVPTPVFEDVKAPHQEQDVESSNLFQETFSVKTNFRIIYLILPVLVLLIMLLVPSNVGASLGDSTILGGQVIFAVIFKEFLGLSFLGFASPELIWIYLSPIILLILLIIIGSYLWKNYPPKEFLKVVYVLAFLLFIHLITFYNDIEVEVTLTEGVGKYIIVGDLFFYITVIVFLVIMVILLRHFSPFSFVKEDKNQEGSLVSLALIEKERKKTIGDSLNVAVFSFLIFVFFKFFFPRIIALLPLNWEIETLIRKKLVASFEVHYIIIYIIFVWFLAAANIVKLIDITIIDYMRNNRSYQNLERFKKVVIILSLGFGELGSIKVNKESMGGLKG